MGKEPFSRKLSSSRMSGPREVMYPWRVGERGGVEREREGIEGLLVETSGYCIQVDATGTGRSIMDDRRCLAFHSGHSQRETGEREISMPKARGVKQCYTLYISNCISLILSHPSIHFDLSNGRISLGHLTFGNYVKDATLHQMTALRLTFVGIKVKTSVEF
jgi:hypothetical protein